MGEGEIFFVPFCLLHQFSGAFQGYFGDLGAAGHAGQLGGDLLTVEGVDGGYGAAAHG